PAMRREPPQQNLSSTVCLPREDFSFFWRRALQYKVIGRVASQHHSSAHSPVAIVAYPASLDSPTQMRSPRTSQQWVDYFQSNAASLLAIPWEAGADLCGAERKAIASSVQEFQIGESSDGLRFIQSAEAYAAKTGDTAYVTALGLFIAEEQRHGRDLG